MQIVTSVNRMRHLSRDWTRSGVKIGFVPTMGYLHAGHMALVERARKAVGAEGKVVVSIYVNPTQFGPKEDFTKYPRDFARDKALCREAGVDLIFAPSDDQMYPSTPQNPYSTYVIEENLSRPMEGASRPTHFRGVTTVVAKLFNLIAPTVAVFGAKDFQQAAIVGRMIRDLNFPVELIVAPTAREPDGLAMSSRNKYLSPDERRQAVILSKAIETARGRVRERVGLPAKRLANELARLIEAQPSARIDYIAFIDPVSLQPAPTVKRGTRLALAVFIGKTRLIDNAAL